MNPRTRLVRLLRVRASTAPVRVLKVTRAEATLWGSARRLVAVQRSDGDFLVAWYENQVWHVGRVKSVNGHRSLSPTQVESDLHAVTQLLTQGHDDGSGAVGVSMAAPSGAYLRQLVLA